MDTTETMSFGQWLQQLDTLTRKKADLSVHQLTSAGWRQRYDDGLTPQEAFDDYARDLLEDLGFPLEIEDAFDDAAEAGTRHFSALCVAEAGLEYRAEEELYLSVMAAPDLDEHGVEAVLFAD